MFSRYVPRREGGSSGVGGRATWWTVDTERHETGAIRDDLSDVD